MGVDRVEVLRAAVGAADRGRAPPVGRGAAVGRLVIVQHLLVPLLNEGGNGGSSSATWAGTVSGTRPGRPSSAMRSTAGLMTGSGPLSPAAAPPAATPQPSPADPWLADITRRTCAQDAWPAFNGCLHCLKNETSCSVMRVHLWSLRGTSAKSLGHGFVFGGLEDLTHATAGTPQLLGVWGRAGTRPRQRLSRRRPRE